MQYETISIETLNKINKLTNENKMLIKKQKQVTAYIKRLLVLNKKDVDAVLITIKSMLEEK